MKNYFLLIAAAVALLCATPCLAQNQAIYAQTVPVQSNGVSASHIAVAASAATNFNVVIDVRKQKNVELQIVTTNTVPDAVTKNTLYYQRSVDGVKYDTALSPIAWTTALAVDPANPLVITTNLDTFGCGFIRFPYLTNACSSATNLADFNLQYAIKIGAP